MRALFTKISTRQRLTLRLIGLFLLLVLSTAALREVLPGAAWDVTADKLYALSEGSKTIVGRLPEPVTLRLYFSSSLGEAAPLYATYAQRVEDLLRAYARASDDKVRIITIDPQPFSEEEDAALADGLQGVRLNTAGDKVYFGLVASNSTDGKEVIPFLQPEREPFLEYDITKILSSLSHTTKKRVAVLSTLPIEGDPSAVFLTGRSERPWFVLEQLRQLFDVTMIAADAQQIPAGTDVLILIQPDDIQEAALRAIDAYAARGGRLLVFTDPLPEASRSKAQLNINESAAPTFTRLLAHWGVGFQTDKVAADVRYARKVAMRLDDREVDAPYYAWLALDGAALASDDQITADIGMVNVASAGAFTKLDGGAVSVAPLLQTSPHAALLDLSYFRPAPDMPRILWEFKAGDAALTLAARITGVVTPFFKETVVKPGAEPAPLHAVIVADTDMLRDAFWLQTGSFYGTDVAMPVAGNGALVVNAVENLLGSSELISLRSRGTMQRPFTRLVEKTRAAEQRFRSAEQNLRGDLQQTEARLNELLKSDDNAQGALLTAEQEQVIGEAQQKLLALRQQLRAVQRALREDLENLQHAVIFINIALVPLSVLLLAAFMQRRRRRHRHSRMAA